MKVQFFGGIRTITGEAEREVEAENIESLLRTLSCAYAPQFKKMLFLNEMTLRKNVVILKNGKNIQLEQGLATPLGERDVVCIFPPLGGG